MESQLHRPAAHTYDQDPHNAGLHYGQDEGEQHHQEKKSVLKKVKDKAKKIKEKLHGHGHENEEYDFAHGGDHDDHEEEEDDDDHELIQDPEVHGAPMYESVAIRNAAPAHYDNPKRDYRMEEDNVGFGQDRPKIGVTGGLQVDPHAPKSRPGEILGSNYESKVQDSSGEGGEEVDLSSLAGSLDKMVISEKRVGTESGYTGSHDQFAPQDTPTEGEFGPKTSSGPETATGKSSEGSGYVEKISVATSMIADKALSAKNVVASKLGYGGTEGVKGQMEESKDAAGKTGASASPTEYVYKVAATVSEKLAPVYDKVAGAGSSVVSKVKGSGAAGHEEATAETSGGVAPDKGVSVKEYLAEKLKPGEEDKALSEMISDTLHKKKQDSGKPVALDPAGKVTESEEVARYLGSGMENKREGEDAIAAGKESSGSGVMDRIKGAVSCWIGKGAEQEYTKGSVESSYVDNQPSAATADDIGHQPESTTGCRLEESGH